MKVWRSYHVAKLPCGKVTGNHGGDLGKCVGPQHTFNSPRLLPTLTFPYISPYFPHTPSHFTTTPLIPLPTSPFPPPIPQHMFLLSPHLPSPSQRVAKLPCDEVSVAKLLAIFTILVEIFFYFDIFSLLDVLIFGRVRSVSTILS